MGKLHTGLRVGFYTIYLHQCESKLKCITAVDLKTTLDPPAVSFHIYMDAMLPFGNQRYINASKIQEI